MVNRPEGAAAGLVVLVTGANRGIGFEVCRLLVKGKHHAILTGRDRDRVADAAALLADAVPLVLDYDKPDTIEAAAAFVDERFGHLDVLVNNAYQGYDPDEHASTVDLGAVEHALRTNLVGPWRTIQAFLPLLRRSAHARIVNVSSGAGSTSSTRTGAPAYVVVKAGLNALTRLLANELAGEHILINAVAPGQTSTGMNGGRGQPAHVSAAGVMRAITLPDDGPSGTFFRDGEQIPW